MNTVNYAERKTFVKYDDDHFLLYLNEQEVEFQTAGEDGQPGETVQGYSYTGEEADGSTKIAASGVTDANRRDKFIAGLIGLSFDIDAQIAILANDGDTEVHAEELENYKTCRAQCKVAVDELLGRTI